MRLLQDPVLFSAEFLSDHGVIDDPNIYPNVERRIYMKTTDKFLTGIVIGIVVLVVVAFAFALLRPEPAYLPDGTPDAAAHNYLLALQQSDYERAYQYLSPSLRGYPESAEEFATNVEDNSWNFRLDQGSVSLEVTSTAVTGNRATVRVLETRFNENGLFDSSQYTDTFEMHLERSSSEADWKIIDSNSYWAWCWDNIKGCP